jgi:hypothetical protein
MTRVTSCTFSLIAADLVQACASAHHFDPHLHGTFSIVILTKGRAWLRSARWTAIAEAGDVFISIHSRYTKVRARKQPLSIELCTPHNVLSRIAWASIREFPRGQRYAMGWCDVTR